MIWLHIHGILMIYDNKRVTARVTPTFGDIIGSFKSECVNEYLKFIRKKKLNISGLLWQRNYYEHIIRNDEELEKYRSYIKDNPSRWRLKMNISEFYSAAHGPFGGAQKTWTNTYDPRLKYSGKEREGYTDFDYFGARYYDHNSYRFISTDPIINKEEALTNPQLWNLYAYCRNNPITYLDPDGRAENSLSNIWERIKISFTALKYEGSTAWAKNKKKDDFGRGKYKCNKFVYDVTKEAGALAEIKIGNKTYRLPRAGEWANKNAKIANWRVLKSGEKIHPGDVAAYKLSGGGREFSGHTGIMIMNKKSKFTNISAHVEDISTVPNQFLGNRDTVYRRYTGD